MQAICMLWETPRQYQLLLQLVSRQLRAIGLVPAAR